MHSTVAKLSRLLALRDGGSPGQRITRDGLVDFGVPLVAQVALDSRLRPKFREVLAVKYLSDGLGHSHFATGLGNDDGLPIQGGISDRHQSARGHDEGA